MPVTLPPERAPTAKLLVALGSDRAAGLLRGMSEAEVEMLVADMAVLGPMTTDESREVLIDFTRGLLARQTNKGGLDYAKKVLTQVYGPDHASTLTHKIDPRLSRPFLWLETLDIDDLVDGLSSQPPATITVALAHISPSVSGKILKRLKEPLQSDVALRMASLTTIAPDVMEAIDKSLRERLKIAANKAAQDVEGVGILVDVLNQTSPKLQRSLIEAIKERDGNLAGRIQERLFVFEDILMLDDRAVQQVLKSIETMDLAFALKGAAEEITDLLFRNLSERARDSLKEEIDYLENPKAAEVKSAKSRIVAAIRDLEETGVIEIARPGVDADEDDG